MIEVTDLFKQFGERTAVNHVTFSVRGGETYGLLGPNGSGKSTVMRMMVGILQPTSGRISINGASEPLELKRLTGYVPEAAVLFDSLTPGEMFSFVASVRGVPQDEVDRRVRTLVRAFDIEEYLEQFVGTLSFGTKQKVSLISALLHEPAALVLDEALNGLDPKSARIMREILQSYKDKGKSIIFSTHVLPLAEMLCDRIGLIYQGRLVAEGSIAELKGKAHEENLEDVFLKLTESKGEVDEIITALRGP